jgi:hypothetical protein
VVPSRKEIEGIKTLALVSYPSSASILLGQTQQESRGHHRSVQDSASWGPTQDREGWAVGLEQQMKISRNFFFTPWESSPALQQEKEPFLKKWQRSVNPGIRSQNFRVSSRLGQYTAWEVQKKKPEAPEGQVTESAWAYCAVLKGGSVWSG